jgi:hypothetical protein
MAAWEPGAGSPTLAHVRPSGTQGCCDRPLDRRLPVRPVSDGRECSARGGSALATDEVWASR